VQAREYAEREARLIQREHEALARVQLAQSSGERALAAKRRNVEEAARVQESRVRTNFQRAQVVLKQSLARQQGFLKQEVGELQESGAATRHLKVQWNRMPVVRLWAIMPCRWCCTSTLLLFRGLCVRARPWPLVVGVQPFCVTVHKMTAVKNKLPSARYVILATLYSRWVSLAGCLWYPRWPHSFFFFKKKT
jgi:hypothetical protein